VVTYTGDNVAGREIPHNLGCEPGMIIVKCTTLDQHWAVWHRLGPNNRYFLLNFDWQGVLDSPPTHFYPFPTDTHFQVGIASPVNGAGLEYVAYVFAHDDSDESMIKCGGYKSTNSTEEIELGWEPQFLLIKCASVGGAGCNWQLLDCMRGLGETSTASVIANTEDKEYDVDPPMAVATAKGFKLVTNSGSNTNSPGDYIYMAIRRPNKPAEEFEAEELFDIAYGDGSGSPDFKGPLTDFRLSRDVNQTSSVFAGSRLQGTKHLNTAESEDESNASYSKYDYMDGWSDLGLASPNMSWMWRRAPGYFDVVPYDSTNDGTSNPLDLVVPHNLGAVPEMMWVKRRNADGYWMVWHDVMNPGDALRLHDESLLSSEPKVFVSRPTAESFTLGGSSFVNAFGDHNYIAYLFASVPGICDIGTYTANGPNGNITEVDCGFTNGARFVLVKRVDGIGNWMYWDALRGITSTLSLNTTDAAGYDNRYYQWPKGFKVNSLDSDGTYWNPSIDGAEYIYMAIA
jgi:hypothetical protein